MRKEITCAFLLMGFTSLIVQTLLIREFLISFYGNELSIGLILANWIILEALGSGISSRAAEKAKQPYLIYALLQTGIALYLALSVFLIRNIGNILGLTRGEGVGILPILFSSFFILAPLSFFDGAQFPFGCRILSGASNQQLESAGRVYILEAAGFILAGPVFTYILITNFNSFSIAFLLGLLNLLSAILLLKDKLRNNLSKSFFAILNTLLVLMLLALFAAAGYLHKLSINKQWRGQEVLSYDNSIYANLTVTKSKGQYTFYNNGIPIITAPLPDIAYTEEMAHFSMLSSPNPKSVLLISGGAGGLIKELLKYNNMEKLTYVELDPLLIELIKKFPTQLTKEELSDPRLDIRHIDARRFIRLTKARYDVVILNLPMPSTLQLNRFYTQEFFREVKAALTEKGIFSLCLPGSLSYINAQTRNLNAAILNTLKDAFYVDVIPGDFNLYLAAKSNFEVSQEIFLTRIAERNIQTRLLNKTHLEYRLNPSWRKWFYGSLGDYTHLKKNSDFLPAGVFYSVSYWNNIFSANLQWLFGALDKLNFKILLACLFIFGLALFLLKTSVPKFKKMPVGFAIMTTGFTGLSFELIFIYAYQSLYGFVFGHLALLVTAFMSGLTLGGYFMTRGLLKIKNDLTAFSKIETALTCFCLLAGPLLISLKHLPVFKLSYALFLLSAVAGCLVGLEFPLANKIYGQDKMRSKTAGILYALDLAGAYLAALAVSIALVPVIGIIKTCLFLAGLKIISLILVASNSRPQV